MDANTPKVAVAASYVAMVVFNILSFTGVFGEDFVEISADNPTWVTPDGKTFAIWGVIYTLHLLLVVRQCSASPEDERLLSQRCPLTGLEVRWRIVLAFLCNAVWLPTYAALNFGLALIIILSYLGVLLSVYTALNSRTCTASLCQWLSLEAPVAANASWLVVATSANAFMVGRQLGWADEYGIGGSVRAGAVVAVLAATVGSVLALDAGDVAWGLAASWALAGLYRMQTVPDADVFPPEALSPFLASVALASSVVAAAAALLGCCVLWKQLSAAKAGHCPLQQA